MSGPEGPWILGLNAASDTLAVALARGEIVRAEAWSEAPNRHGEHLFEAVEALLKLTEVKREGLGAVAVATGPGGFTGIRTALAAAKGMALVLDLPLIGVSTLLALAQQAPGASWVAPWIDARRGDVFGALYQREAGVLQEVLAPELASAEVWGDRLARRAGVLAVGSGALAHAAVLEARGIALSEDPMAHRLRAGTIATLGARAWRQGEVMALDEVQPAYLRPPSAIAHWGPGGAP